MQASLKMMDSKTQKLIVVSQIHEPLYLFLGWYP